MFTFDMNAAAIAGAKLFSAAGANPVGAAIVIGGALIALALWIWSKK